MLKPPKEFDPLEEKHQEMIFSWAALHQCKYPELEWLFHVPNGGYRRKAEAAALTRRGVKSGVADIFLPFGHGGWPGLIIELKRYEEGELSDNQKRFLKAMARAGWKSVLCWGERAAIWEIEQYLILPPTTELLHRGGYPTERKDRDYTS